MRLIFLVPFALFLGCSSNLEPEEQFSNDLTTLCGQAFEGKVVSTDEADADWRKEVLTMHIRDCSDGEVKIALHVGEDRSRTWILRGEDGNLALRHDHRHKDGKPDALTYYGGLLSDTARPGRLEFPADQSTKDLFDREGISVSKDNIWAMEIDVDAERFAYEMKRPNRFFRAEFDLSKAVETPPTPWGW